MLDIKNESAIRVSKIPDWCAEHIGHTINRSTVFRWRTRGCRGVKLETILVGNARYSTLEALERFFAGSTAAADGNPYRNSVPFGTTDPIQRAKSYLDSEGI